MVEGVNAERERERGVAGVGELEDGTGRDHIAGMDREGYDIGIQDSEDEVMEWGSFEQHGSQVLGN